MYCINQRFLQPMPQMVTLDLKTEINTRGFESPTKTLPGKTPILAPELTTGMPHINKNPILGQKIPFGLLQVIPIGRTNIPFVQTATVNSNSNQFTSSDLDHDVIKTSYDLPTFLLANLQSVGISGDNDKSPDLSVMLEQNNIDIACLTETWLTENNQDRMHFDNYVCFNLVRKSVRRASGGVSILVKEGLPTINLNMKVPDHIECMWLALRPNKLPRCFLVIIVACQYYPGTTSDYAPSQEDIMARVV